ncbi:hypothetical protein Axi01nite_51060 [Actinoplanes xinjiangensis]|jgi:hypothetical protein|nr:hypothetical protein Axi01nite_51060 [Actinoplanes xinjiangensis]
MRITHFRKTIDSRPPAADDRSIDMSGRTLGQKLAGGLAATGLLVGGTVAGLAIASPAQAACASDSRTANINYAYAEAHTEDCSYWSNSYAQHGGTSRFSGWYSGSSWARADSGVSLSYSARNYFE